MELQMSPSNEVHQQQKLEFNSRGLNGLRGFMSVIILLHHTLHRVDFNIYGHVQMPLFFLLSGFCLTLGYGKSNYSSTTLCCCCCLATTKCDCRPCKKVPEDRTSVFDSWKFFQGRMTRILPVYYLTFILGAVLIPFGHGSASPSDIGQSGVGVIFSFFLIQTWFIHAGFAPNPPAWTISTLYFFYLVFPSFLVFAQRRSNKVLAILMALMFYLNNIIGFVIMFKHEVFWINAGQGYWFSTAWPFVRLPIFLMGVFAGVLCVRLQNGDFEAVQRLGRWSENCFMSFIQDTHLPFPFFQKIEDNPSLEVKQRSWKRRTDVNMGFYLLTLFTFFILNTYYKFNIPGYDNLGNAFYSYNLTACSYSGIPGGETNTTSNDTTAINETNVSNVTEEEAPDYTAYVIFRFVNGHAMQFTACYMQLMIIVGLCLDGTKSLTGRFFNTKVMQFLGRISMSMYLVHIPLMKWIEFLIHGTVEWSEGKREDIEFPAWALPVHVAISVAFAVLITIFFEEPARKIFDKALGRNQKNKIKAEN